MTSQHDKWIEAGARTGYSARGVVYAILGGLVIAGGVRSAEHMETKDAISALLGQPFGVVLVFLLFLGLCCYVAWRLVQVVFDPDDQWDSFKGVFIRGALLVSAASYTFLAFYALTLLNVVFSSGGGDDGSELRDFLNGLIGARYAALAFAAVFAATAVAHWHKAIGGSYEKYFKASDETMTMLRPIIVVGLCARGVVFAIIAWLMFTRFLYVSEQNTDAQPGLKEALGYLSDLPYGPWLIMAMGTGLVAFALYSFAEARWRRIGDIG